MARPDSASSGKQVLRPRARILRTLGDELVSSETVAILELVKNAYDADATRVLVRFQESLEIGKGKIEVIDNGHGMSIETIRTTWMEPATLVKRRKTRSERLGRRVLGEKGIGRFAASRVADFLEVVTRRIGAENEVRAFFDWSQFDDQSKYLDEVEILWEEARPSEICAAGTIEALWPEGNSSMTMGSSHGTILRMEGLRATWGKPQLEKLRSDLSRLVSPLPDEHEPTSDDEFQINLELPTPFDSLSGIVNPPEGLKSPHYTLSGSVDQSGHFDLTLRLRGVHGETHISGSLAFEDGHPPRCGPFRIELRVWDRDPISMVELADSAGSKMKGVRRDLDAAAGINIYRDGFRVLPYGEPRDDWLRLDIRRVQNPTLRLSNNQIVGYVLISADENPSLRDQSNREGLVEGPSLDDLRGLLKMVLAQLETRRYGLRHPQNAGQPSTRQGGLFAGFDLVGVHDLVKKRYPDDTEVLAAVSAKERDLEVRVGRVQEVLARYMRLATLGQLIDHVLHEGRTPLSKIRKEAYQGARNAVSTGEQANRLMESLARRFEVIQVQSGVLATVFDKIEPFGGRKRGRPARYRLEQLIGEAFSVLDSEIAEIGAEVSLPSGDTQVTVDRSEIQEVMVNLLDNSLYWLRSEPRDRRKISVQTRRTSPDDVEILFSDSGPGVTPEFRERIFEPYFSTKPDGVGIGLSIAGEIVSEYYGGSLVLLSDGPLSGATFLVTLRRRV